VKIHCRMCHRSERWSEDGVRTVEAAGGGRRSATPERDAFEALADSFSGRFGPVVAACPACAGPMLSDGGGQRIAWTLLGPRGPIVFAADGTIASPDGPTLDDARIALDTSFPRPVVRESKMAIGFGGSLVFMMLAPVAVWMMGVFFLVMFLTHVGSPVSMP
jgi:hypothetical protein